MHKLIFLISYVDPPFKITKPTTSLQLSRIFNIISLGSYFCGLDTVDVSLQVFQNCVLMMVMLRFCYTHTKKKKNQLLLMLQFCLKINPLDYLFSPAAELFISLAANIRISTQNFSMYAQKKIQYNLLITSTVREPLVLCMVQTAVLVQ